MTTELLQLNSSVLFGHGGDLQDVVHRQQLGQEGSHRILEPLHQIKVRHGQQSAEVLTAVHLWKSNPVHEVDDGAEDIVGALLHIDSILPFPHPCVQCSLEVLRPDKRMTFTSPVHSQSLYQPHAKDERVSLDDFALAGESEVAGLVLALVQLGHARSEVGGGKAHPIVEPNNKKCRSSNVRKGKY